MEREKIIIDKENEFKERKEKFVIEEEKVRLLLISNEKLER